MTLPAYIIHLERAKSRRPQAEALRASLGPAAQILPAVDGQILSDSNIAHVLGPCRATRYPFPLRPAEIATFLSHRKCWQRLLEDGHEAALIVEDDIATTATFSPACALALEQIVQGQFVRFPGKKREAGEVLAAADGVELFRPQRVALGMLAQIVTREAAARLLAASTVFDRPVDTFLQLRWVHGADVVSVWPSGISEISADLGGSTIHANMPWPTKLRREILRPLYRLSIRLQSDRHNNAS
ncbi:MAG: glycosyltransferase family 25 protein [Zhengella sp.]|uniref:glycosyltransferase family 25 protein n=1 Tax=Zhengella sp. TaxID=2282762 RepID=UPI001DBEE62C|nr:glycosyltransferase family 25 protein [Notoacmeibacter sp.]